MYLRDPQGLDHAGGGGRPVRRGPVHAPADGLRARLRLDWTPDLGARIGTRDWWRGLATVTALAGAGWVLMPPLRPLTAAVPAPLAGDEWAEARTLAIAPLGRGAATGRRMAANDLVRPLAEVPERPQVELAATLGAGDNLTGALGRAGVGEAEAEDVAAMVSAAAPLTGIKPGTRLDLVLGRRPDRRVARPLTRLAFRAAFDLNLEVTRTASGQLGLVRHPIAIDHTPLRLEGRVGASLFRAVRAAGAPAQAAEDYMKALSTRLSVGRDIGAGDRYDLVVERARAATGEVELGRLLLAGLSRPGGRAVELVRWRDGGGEDWFDTTGRITHQGAMEMPVPGRVTSSFGWRFHPILGFARMHKGMDVAAPYGTPIVAAIDGRVEYAGWHGGHGNYVQLQHGGQVETGYGHMSRIAVRVGQAVRRGQVIGYVGMTGLTTGPHVHWEVMKKGVFINPLSIRYASVTALAGSALQAFKAHLSGLLAAPPGR